MDEVTAAPGASAGAGGAYAVSVDTSPPDWLDYLSGSDRASLLHDPRWGRIYADVYGSDVFYLTARCGDRVAGVLTLVGRRSWLFGSSLCSLPYFDSAGVLADDDGASRALLDSARALRESYGADWVELRQLEPLGADIPARTDKVTMVLPLPSGADAMWNFLKSKVRTKVRKAQKADLDLNQGGLELLDRFYPVYARTMRDLGSPPHSRRFFQAIGETFGDAVRLFAVQSQNEVVAASFTLSDRLGFHVPWSGSDRRVRDRSGNRMLYWSMLADACDRGSRSFDFGRSTRGSGTYEFKKEWGAEEVPLHWHYLLAPGRDVPDLRPDSPKYRLAVAAWQRLPVGMACALGPRLISKLS